VIEADEYDRMFLGLSPEIAVVTNVEHDHPDCFPTPEVFQDAFRAFVGRIKPDGVLILCGDDPGASALLPAARSRGLKILTYGVSSSEVDYAAADLRAATGRTGYSFRIYSDGQHHAAVELQVPGLHNVLNALAALAVADQLSLPLEAAANALSGFRGTGRRFEIIGEAQGVTVVSDYGHHPTEIRATLAAARSRHPDREIWAVWQPHTYSRTKLFFDDFAGSFQDADHVLVTEIYPARERIETNYSASQFIGAMNHPDANFKASLSDAAELLKADLGEGDVLVVLSAGDADQICWQVLDALA
jgi:UDP-N-acetylmuramate--alanine ligase